MPHGFVVASGIPAVVGLEKETERLALADGQMVRVDGSNGTVEIIDEGDSSD